MVTALAAALTLNLGFIPPYGTLSITDVNQGSELAAFLAVALLVGQLVTRLVHRRTEVSEVSQQIRALDERVEEFHHERTDLARQATRAEELERLDVQRAALLRSVSHDLRTPLASIRAVATDLRDDVPYDAETRVELLTTVCDEVDRLDRFVANLLSMSRIDAGVFEPDRQAVDIHDIVADRVKQLAPILRDVVVRIDVRPGIPLKEVDRLFEPFERGRGSSSSGIGLAICRSIVTAHGGTIGVRRTFGGGATFSFTVPIHVGDQI